ncbi:MAG: TSUP family transporter [Neisseria sp.]|nr:TSUP family transporter [Neisseria sp.]
MELTLQLLSLLFAVAFVAGFVDAMAGGGGLLTLPVLMLTGMPTVSVLATNKLQSSAGSLSASITMIKKGLVRPKEMKTALLLAFVGSALGTILVQLSPPDFLKKALPIVLALVGVYTLFSSNLGKLETAPRLSQKQYECSVVPLIGFYDGYFGPGTGMFLSLSQVVCRGREWVQATANAKLLNFATNLAALLFFILGGQVVWLVGLVMMVGQIIGAYFGSRMVFGGGTRFIRPVIVCMCFAMVIKLLLN